MKKYLAVFINLVIGLFIVSAGYANAQITRIDFSGSRSSSIRQMSAKKDVPAVKTESITLDKLIYPDGTPCEAGVHEALKPGKEFSPKIHAKFVNAKVIEILEKIYTCQPFKFPQKDGSIFKNLENLLPKNKQGFYREYTLIPDNRKPGDGKMDIEIGNETYTVTDFLGGRGAERIIVGGNEIIYYTPDHYRTFIELKVVK